MNANLAALQEAAEALARACQDADAGLTFEAAFAAERSSLCAGTAFEPGSPQAGAWNLILAVIDAELTVGGVRMA